MDFAVGEPCEGFIGEDYFPFDVRELLHVLFVGLYDGEVSEGLALEEDDLGLGGLLEVYGEAVGKITISHGWFGIVLDIIT